MLNRKRILSLLLVFTILCSVAVTGFSVSAKNTGNPEKIICQATLEDDFADDCVLVVINKQNSKVNKLFTKDKFKGVDLESVKDLTHMEGDTDKMLYFDEENFYQILKLNLVKKGKKEVLKAIRKLEKLDFILAVEPSYYFYPTELPKMGEKFTVDGLENEEESTEDSTVTDIETQNPVNTEELSLLESTDTDVIINDDPEETGGNADTSDAVPLSNVPDDPQYTDGTQWGLNQIKAQDAWEITTGKPTVLVGVIDSGIADHPDLRENVRRDLGWDFYNENADTADDDNYYFDEETGNRYRYYHGTHVAGIIGAKGNNGIGVTGVCWDVGLVPLQVIITDEGKDEGKFDGEAIGEAINHAIENNIQILNCSFGHEGKSVAYDKELLSYKGLVVCSAGNESIDTDKKTYMPSCFDAENIISVGASDDDKVDLATATDWGYKEGESHGSNFGVETVDIAAPGTNVYNTIPEGFGLSIYAPKRGTSMAAPFVSGVAALILSVRPGLPGSHLKYLLTHNATCYSELQDKVGNNGAYLNAYKAVNAAMDDAVKVVYNANNGTVSERYYVPGLAYFDLPQPTRTGCVFNKWYYGTTPVDVNSIVPSGENTIYLYANWRAKVTYDDVGSQVAEDIIYFGKNGSFEVTKTTRRLGYKFVGWKHLDRVYKCGETITGIEGNIVLTAQWEELFCVINYEAPHFDPIPPMSVYYSEAQNYQNKIPVAFLHTPLGMHILQGWKIKGGDGTVYSPSDSESMLDFKCYTFEEAGVMERVFGEVFYDANGGQNAPPDQTRLGENFYIIIAKDEPTREGYTFLGWADNDTYPEEEVYAPGELCGGQAYLTLHAKWIDDGFVIRFDTGTDETDAIQAYDPPKSIEYLIPGEQPDEGITIPDEIPTRPSYRFKGWSYTYNGTTAVYNPGDTFLLPAGALADYNPNGSNIVRLFPIWEKIPNMHPEDFPDEQLMEFVDLTEYGGVNDTTYLRIFTPGKTYGEIFGPDDPEKTSAFPVPEEQTVQVDGVKYYFDGWADAEGNIIKPDTVITKEGFHYIYARWIPEANFSDVMQGSTPSKYISKCSYYGYMLGTSPTTFEPDSNVTRATAATVLFRQEGSPKHGNNRFYDVDTYKSDGVSNPVSEAITWAYENGISSGVDYYEFGTDTDVTREQLVSMLYRYAKYKGLDVSDVDNTCLNGYEDCGSVSDYARDAMVWAVSNKIISGVSDVTLSPKGTVTREQLAILITKMRNLLIDAGKITTLKAGSPVNTKADTVGYISTNLADNSWEQIKIASEAGVASHIWNVGDEKDMTLSTGETVTVQIYGFNHDDLTGGGKAGITFGLKNIMNSAYAINGADTNENSFVGTTMYQWLNSTVYDSLPDDLRTAIKAADKKTTVGGGSMEYRTDSMNLFLFSENECFGVTYHSAGGEGEKYPIFTDNQSRIKGHASSQIIEWWLRSPRVADSTSFGIVHATGHAGYVHAAWPYAGVCFGFCV